MVSLGCSQLPADLDPGCLEFLRPLVGPNRNHQPLDRNVVTERGLRGSVINSLVGDNHGRGSLVDGPMLNTDNLEAGLYTQEGIA